MFLHIDFKAGKPAYLQIVEQVKYAAASGALRPGDSLPSIRSLAEKLRINRNTVVKAYEELEAQGVIETRQGKGSVLSEQATKLTKNARMDLIAASVDRMLTDAHHLRISKEELFELLDSRYHELNGKAIIESDME